MSVVDMQDWRETDMSQSNPWHLKKIRKNIEDLKAVLQPGDSLLDAGCFQGHLYKAIGHEPYLGIDLRESNIAEARRLNPGVAFKVGDIYDLSGSWDVVFCCRVLVHLPDYKLACERLMAAAKKACVVVILIGEDITSVETYEGRKVYFRSFSRQTVESVGPCDIIKRDERSPYSTVIYRGG